MTTMMLRALCAGLLLLMSQMSAAAVKTSLEYLYYLADANSGGSLAAILKRSKPGTDDHLGWTTWHVNWHYDSYINADGSCRITDSTTELTATITLPKLINGSTAQVNVMNSFLTALRAHELGHVNIGTEAAEAVDRAIPALPQMATCELLAAEANRVVQRILDEYREAEKRYDIETDHGKSQGAVLRD